MCGVVGLFLKNDDLRPRLGDLLSDMLISMSDRGPDSAGVALYGEETDGLRLTVQSKSPESDFPGLEAALAKQLGAAVTVQIVDTHAVVTLPSGEAAQALADRARTALEARGLRVMGSGRSMLIFKEVGLPKDVVARFGLRGMAGGHGVGHTRMATESAVTTLGAHPFSTGDDQCLVHNGSLSNHNLRARELARMGFGPKTENDTEVAACYVSSRLAAGDDLGSALEGALRDLDGFFTFVVGSKNGFGVVRDPIACKPAVMAETEDYVAFGSEYRALASLPGVEAARVWEPEPATVYFWER